MFHLSKMLFLCLITVIILYPKEIRGYGHHDYYHHPHHSYDHDHDYDHDFANNERDSKEDDRDHDDMRDIRAFATSPPPPQDLGAAGQNSCTCNVKDYVPQCGSDGLTYVDPCRFKCAQLKNPSLKLAKAGECKPAVRNGGTAVTHSIDGCKCAILKIALVLALVTINLSFGT